mgnify:CR=1 FL=1
MSFTKTIIGLTLSMLLGSGVANADWGDVYYCQMTNSFGITPEGEKKNYILEKFQFKLDQTKNAMVFGSTGTFKGQVIELVIGSNFPSQEFWYAKGRFSSLAFANAKFLYSNTNDLAVHVASADCDKF